MLTLAGGEGSLQVVDAHRGPTDSCDICSVSATGSPSRPALSCDPTPCGPGIRGLLLKPLQLLSQVLSLSLGELVHVEVRRIYTR